MPPNTNQALGPALVIDGSSTCFFAGVLGRNGQWLAQKKANEPALEVLFGTVQEVLQKAGLELESIQSYIYCEGPGSVLGLRLCAMAIETWRRLYPDSTKLYAYNSLNLVAAQLQQTEPNTDNALLISDWKKNTWNSLKVGADPEETVTPIHSEELAKWDGPVYHLPARKGWQKAPENTIEVSYEPEQLPELFEKCSLLEPRETITLYNSGINSFQKWTPERHRGPSPAK